MEGNGSGLGGLTILMWDQEHLFSPTDYLADPRLENRDDEGVDFQWMGKAMDQLLYRHNHYQRIGADGYHFKVGVEFWMDIMGSFAAQRRVTGTIGDYERLTLFGHPVLRDPLLKGHEVVLIAKQRRPTERWLDRTRWTDLEEITAPRFGYEIVDVEIGRITPDDGWKGIDIGPD